MYRLVMLQIVSDRHCIELNIFQESWSRSSETLFWKQFTILLVCNSGNIKDGSALHTQHNQYIGAGYILLCPVKPSNPTKVLCSDQANDQSICIYINSLTDVPLPHLGPFPISIIITIAVAVTTTVTVAVAVSRSQVT